MEYSSMTIELAILAIQILGFGYIIFKIGTFIGNINESVKSLKRDIDRLQRLFDEHILNVK